MSTITCNVEEFFRVYPRPPLVPASEDEIRTKAKRMASNVWRTYEYLNRLLQSHEATIRSRWSKKTKQQRIALLRNCWPDMALGHRPDLRALDGDEGNSDRLADCFIWPTINQLDLSRTKALLLLINSRGRNNPSTFAATELDPMYAGIRTSIIPRIHLIGHTMMLNQVTKAEDYGVLKDWDNFPDAIDWLATGKQFGPEDGVLILEAQEKLMRFLVRCCKQILHEILPADLFSEKYPIKPEPPFRPEVDRTGHASLAIDRLDAPYKAPIRLDLDRVEALLGAKTRAAEDHLWALRDDPQYFHEAVLDQGDHRQEHILGLRGQVHPTLRLEGGRPLFWTRTIREVLTTAYMYLEIFAELHQQARKLISLHEKYKHEITPMRDLPKPFQQALLKFYNFARQSSYGPKTALSTNWIASPPIRKLYTRGPPKEKDGVKVVAMSRNHVQRTVNEARLEILFTMLWNSDAYALYRQSDTTDELSRYLTETPEAGRDLITANTAAILGNICIIQLCTEQVSHFHPWSTNFDMECKKVFSELETAVFDKGKSWIQLIEVFDEKDLAPVTMIQEPQSDGKFDYPFDKRRTKEDVALLREKEGDLDAFWTGIDHIMHAKFGSLRGTAMHGLLSQPRLLRRTAKWVEGAKASAQPPMIEQPVSPLYLALLGSGSKRPHVSLKKPGNRKTKTSKTGTQGPGPQDDEKPLRFPVDNRALKVFRILFFDPYGTTTPGQVSWNDFLHAMSAAGFIPEALYGSFWHFTPTKLGTKTSILFNDPHPKAKLSFTKARHYGRRLTRNYGLVGETFVLDK